MESGAVERAGWRRLLIRTEPVNGDKVYSNKKIRCNLPKRGIGAVIVHRKNEQQSGCFDKASYRKRNVVERLVDRLKQHRCTSTRCEKCAIKYVGMLTIVATVL